jgi:hypothetical protein
MASLILFRSNSTKQPKMANPYEAPGCQEANDPYERIFSLFRIAGAWRRWRPVSCLT